MHGFIFGSVKSDTGMDPGFLDSEGFVVVQFYKVVQFLQSGWGFDLFIVPDYLLFFPEFSEMSMEFEYFCLKGVLGEPSSCGSATWILFTATALTLFSSTYGNITM